MCYNLLSRILITRLVMKKKEHKNIKHQKKKQTNKQTNKQTKTFPFTITVIDSITTTTIPDSYVNSDIGPP